MSRIMIAGTGSGSGKTTIVCGLCRCIKDLGRDVSCACVKNAYRQFRQLVL